MVSAAAPRHPTLEDDWPKQSFDELAEQVAGLQARLVEKHRHEISQLQHRISVLENRSNSIPTPPKEHVASPANSPKGEPPILPASHFMVYDLPTIPQAVPLVAQEGDELKETQRADGVTKFISDPGALSKRSDSALFRSDPGKRHLTIDADFEWDRWDSPSTSPTMQHHSEGDNFSFRPQRAESAESFSECDSVGVRSEGSALAKKLRSAKIKARLSVAGKVARMAAEKSDELEERALESSSKDTFKIRDMWDLNEKDLLRMKQKSLANRATATTFPLACREMTLFMDKKMEDWFVLHPQSRKRLVWDVIAIVCLTYDLITIPLQAFELPDHITLHMFLWITVFYWTLDMGASLITGFFSEGELEMKFRHIAKRYLVTWFPLDCIVTGPEWLSLALEANSSVAESVGLFRFLRGSRFIRAVRFFRLIRVLKLSRILQDLDSRIRDDAVILLLQITRLNLFIILLAHLLACTWYAAGDKESGWVHTENIEKKSLSDRYLYSFQWALARLHPSNMSENMQLRTLTERMLAIFTSLLATVILAVFVSSITTTMVEIRKHRKQLRWKVNVSRKYCREHMISEGLENRVKKWIDTETSRSRISKIGTQIGSVEAELQKMLPKSLFREMRHEAWAPVISRVDFFALLHSQHKTTERDICHHALREIAVLDGDTIFTTGDACNRMLFLVQGTLAYRLGCVMGCREGTFVAEDEMVIPGQWLSEAVLWTPWENCGELAADESEAILLSVWVESFMKVMKAHELSMIDASLYAKSFLEVLNHTDPLALTDLNKGPGHERNSTPGWIRQKSLTSVVPDDQAW